MALLKMIHMSCAAIALFSFVSRGLLMMEHSLVLNRRWVKVLPHVNDTVLFITAVIMAYQWGIAPWDTPWLGVKVLAVLLYIGLGELALHTSLSIKLRISAWIAGLVTFGYIVGLAVSKNILLIY